MNRMKQHHLSSGQVTEIKHALRNASDSSKDAYRAELRYQARKWGLRTDTVEEIARYGHAERSR